MTASRLVLQGGGALGAYQAGVYEALAQANCEPNWISGVSIGGINSALIAGNPPEKRLHALETFWNTVSGRKIWFNTPEGRLLPRPAQPDQRQYDDDARPARLLQAAPAEPLVHAAGRRRRDQLLRYVRSQGDA